MENRHTRQKIPVLALKIWLMLLSGSALFYPSGAFSTVADDSEIRSVGSSIGIDLTVVERRSDGKIVAAGSLFNGRDDDFVIVRYNSDRSLDETFGLSGIVVTDFGETEDRPSSISFGKDGSITVMGEACTKFKDHCAVVVARYFTDGSLDTSFGNGGKLSTQVKGPFRAKHSTFSQNSEGRIRVSATFCDVHDRCLAKTGIYGMSGNFIRLSEVPDRTIELARKLSVKPQIALLPPALQENPMNRNE